MFNMQAKAFLQDKSLALNPISYSYTKYAELCGACHASQTSFSYTIDMICKYKYISASTLARIIINAFLN